MLDGHWMVKNGSEKLNRETMNKCVGNLRWRWPGAGQWAGAPSWLVRHGGLVQDYASSECLVVLD